MATKNEPPAGGDPQPGAVDVQALLPQLMPELIKALMPEFNKTVNGALKNLKTDLGKQFQPLAPNPDDAAPPNPDPANPNPPAPHAPPQGSTPEVNARLLTMQRQMDALLKENKETKAAQEKAEKEKAESERLTAVRNVLNDFPFKSQADRDLIFNAHHKDIKLSEAGEYVADSTTGVLPARDYFELIAERHPNLLAPKGSGGAGAGPGNRGPGGKRWTLSDLEPQKYNSLKPAEQVELQAEIMAGRVTA